MSESKCDHTIGYWNDGIASTGLATKKDLDSGRYQDYEIDEWFKYCPKCGKENKQ